MGVPWGMTAKIIDGRALAERYRREIAARVQAVKGRGGTVRLDAAQGVMGLQVVRPAGLLADPARREALSMALDRETLLAPFNVAGWLSSTRIAPAATAGMMAPWGSSR